MPAASVDVVIVNAGGLMVIVNAAVDDADALSVTFTVNVLAPAPVGVPEIVPAAERFNPAGGVPLANDHAYGGTPPDAASACE